MRHRIGWLICGTILLLIVGTRNVAFEAPPAPAFAPNGASPPIIAVTGRATSAQTANEGAARPVDVKGVARFTMNSGSESPDPQATISDLEVRMSAAIAKLGAGAENVTITKRPPSFVGTQSGTVAVLKRDWVVRLDDSARLDDLAILLASMSNELQEKRSGTIEQIEMRSQQTVHSAVAPDLEGLAAKALQDARDTASRRAAALGVGIGNPVYVGEFEAYSGGGGGSVKIHFELEPASAR